MAADRVKTKKTFDYKMSKKVAELTQVVHMLFMRNHEREVEITTLKQLYNDELDRLHKKYRLELKTAETKLKEHQAKCAAEHAGFTENVVLARIDKAVSDSDKAWQKKYETKDNLYMKEKGDNLALKEEIRLLNEQINSVKNSVQDQSNSLGFELKTKDAELTKLKKAFTSAEKKLTESMSHYETEITALKDTVNEQINETSQAKSMYDEARMNEECIRERYKQLEAEYKSLKKNVSRKQLESAKRSATASPSSPLPHQQPTQEVYEELEMLRKLVQRYRLELSNREGNFNRMFTEKNPVLVDSKSMRNLTSILPLSRTTGREKTFSYASGQVYDHNEQELPALLNIKTKSKSATLIRPRTSLSTRIGSTREGVTASHRLTSLRKTLPLANKSVLTHFNQNGRTN